MQHITRNAFEEDLWLMGRCGKGDWTGAARETGQVRMQQRLKQNEIKEKVRGVCV